MNNENVSPWAWAMRGGLVLGVMNILNFLCSSSDIKILSSCSFLISVLVIVTAYFMAKRYRDMECGGEISYGGSVKFVFLLFMFSSLIESLGVLVDLLYVNTNYLEKMFNELMVVYEEMGIYSSESMDQMEVMLEGILRPSSFAIVTLFSRMISGLFWALILSIVLKRRKEVESGAVEIEVEEDNDETKKED